MKNKKDLISLNSKLYSSLSLEELEERTELGCWTYCMVDWLTKNGENSTTPSPTQPPAQNPTPGGTCYGDSTCWYDSTLCVYDNGCVADYFPAAATE